ncbi:hypothetical protein LX82_01349 [Celeribacter halophilus]|uniref:Uncharacterized protein n=1 Tax=Celeribacter halophilus TaxID=576117 RepID=A0A1I3RHA0_9RHOB|nr:hypothetical protein LX82_01349 [Celeribacter halophilus]SFJ45994.1 hypothetical protein SAMN04488138_105111 [Celeribacter halophilus]
MNTAMSTSISTTNSCSDPVLKGTCFGACLFSCEDRKTLEKCRRAKREIMARIALFLTIEETDHAERLYVAGGFLACRM